jgi:TonB family protein
MIALLFLLLLPCFLMAQQPPAPPPVPAVPKAPSPPPPPPELGKWWKNSEVVNKLQITESQVKQIEQIFLDHRLKLVDLRAELERRELQLKPLMEVDRPDEGKVLAQTERIAAARAELEKANTSMMLAIRRILSVEQWKKLEEIRETRRLPAPPAPPAPPSAPAPPAPPKPVTDASSEDRVYSISDSIRPPVAVFQPLPSYTPEAKEAKIEGIVILQMVIHKDGTVTDVKVIRGLGYGLDEAARDAIVNKWKFMPGTLNGRPVNVRAHVEVSFRLY